jgi:formate C-acetyltransferase
MYNLGTLGGYENAHIEFGMKTGATVDGRRAGVSFASSLGPAAGRDRQGPTAMLNSVARLPHVWLPTSVTVNLTIDPSLLEHNEGIGQLASLIEAHFLSGGQQLQLTLVDQKTLQAARARPADYAHLMVRVAGYAAPFVSLDDATQKEIMARTAHTLL